MSGPDFDLFYEAILDLCADLAKLDPAPDTPDGKLLNALASACETYENNRYSLESQLQGLANLQAAMRKANEGKE